VFLIFFSPKKKKNLFVLFAPKEIFSGRRVVGVWDGLARVWGAKIKGGFFSPFGRGGAQKKTNFFRERGFKTPH